MSVVPGFEITYIADGEFIGSGESVTFQQLPPADGQNICYFLFCQKFDEDLCDCLQSTRPVASHWEQVIGKIISFERVWF
jgi:hypothetical protein